MRQRPVAVADKRFHVTVAAYRCRHALQPIPLAQADMLIFVASETGATWGFAQALHAALVRNGRRVHTSGLEHFQAGAAARTELRVR